MLKHISPSSTVIVTVILSVLVTVAYTCPNVSAATPPTVEDARKEVEACLREELSALSGKKTNYSTIVCDNLKQSVKKCVGDDNGRVEECINSAAISTREVLAESTQSKSNSENTQKYSSNVIPKVNLDGAQIGNIYNGALAVAGAMTVIFIIIGGIRYVISRGDPSEVTKAKNTILYALIGLLIVILAFVIVRFVTGNV